MTKRARASRSTGRRDETRLGERGPTTTYGAWGRAWGLLRLCHPFPSLLVTAVVCAIVPLADRSPSAALWIQLGLGLLCFLGAFGAANDVVDATGDAASKLWKPIPSGRVSRRTATAVATLLAGAGMIVTGSLPLGAWLVGAAGLGCGLIYDFGLNRTRWSWLPMSIALPLVPIWVWLAVGAWSGLLWWALPIGMLLGFALHLVNQAPDVTEDVRAGKRGAAHAMGEGRALRLGLAVWGAAASTATVVLIFAAPSRAGLTAAAAAIALILSARAVRVFGRDGVFGVLATTSAIIAGVFLSAA